jgi:hypothetical protein
MERSERRVVAGATAALIEDAPIKPRHHSNRNTDIAAHDTADAEANTAAERAA